MGVFEFVIAVVAIGTIGQIIREKQKAKYRHQQDCVFCQNGNSEETEFKLNQLDKLEERIKILEKIVTDKGYNLAEEIDRLR